MSDICEEESSDELGSILSRSLAMPNPEVERRLRVYRIGHPASPPIEPGPRPVVERRLRVYTLSDLLLREILRGVRGLEASRGAAPDDLRVVRVHFDYQAGVNLKVYIAFGDVRARPRRHAPAVGRARAAGAHAAVPRPGGTRSTGGISRPARSLPGPGAGVSAPSDPDSRGL